MNTYSLSGDMSITKIKAAVKEEIMERIMAALAEEFTEDSVGMVRGSKKNEIGAVVTTVEVDGEDVPMCVTINVSAKEFTPHVSPKGKHYEPYDFAARRQEYENHQREKQLNAKAQGLEISTLQQRW